MPRFVAPLLAALMVGGGVAMSPVLASPGSGDRPSYNFCPPAKNLVTPHTQWHRHRLGPGIRLAEATVGHGNRRLRINVVRANISRPRVEVTPLHHRLSHRDRLTRLAKQPHVVAATNGTYFNFSFGAPTVPVLGRHGPLVLSRYRETIAGIGTDYRARDGRAWLVGHATSAQGRLRLAGLNQVEVLPGLSIYTSAWGRHRLPLPPLSRAVVIRNGHAVPHTARRQRPPRHGVLLVATSLGSVAWMDSLHGKSPVDVRYRAKTNTHHPFAQAYGVGTKVVSSPNHIRHGLYCNRAEIYAARTDFAWSHHGRQLILATVASPRSAEHYGVDENQMSEVMVDLGAARSYALDGGGSTELVARLGGHALVPQSPLYRGHERPIPIGVGVMSLSKRLAQARIKQMHQAEHPKHKKQKKHNKHKKQKKPGLLGTLLPH